MVTDMMCEYCGKNTATVEVPINKDESMHLCWFCAERKDEILREEVAIVRCKDCKHFYRYGERWGVCEYTREHQEKALDVTPEHFCGWAEKKEVSHGQFEKKSSSAI